METNLPDLNLMQEKGFKLITEGRTLFNGSDEALKEKGFQIFKEGLGLIYLSLKSNLPRYNPGSFRK